MSSSSILRPEIVVVGNRSYRINPSQLPGLEPVADERHQVYREEEEADYYNDNNDEDEPNCRLQLQRTTAQSEIISRNAHVDEAIENDDTIGYSSKENMYFCEVDIASAFYGVLIGKNAENKQKLEQDTNTQIFFPRRDETGPVKIRGQTKASVKSARTRMEIIIDRSRQMQPFTHFLSIPICLSSTATNLKEKYEEFKKEVLQQCSTERGVTNELFQQVNKLHITISTFVLLSPSEIDFLKNTIQDCTNSLLKEYIRTDDDRFRVQIKGLEFMNDDPSFVDVLYAKVHLIDQKNGDRLQRFLDQLNKELFRTGLMKQNFERIKIHITLMNSLLRKDDTGILEAQKTARGRVKNQERESFDAKKILRLFGQYDFGQIELNELHLSMMHQPDRQTGYYGCEMKTLLKPTNEIK